jgi:hypothetical protein
MRLNFILVPFVMIFISNPALAGWADFNGFSPGMTKSAAKLVGYGVCRNGDGVGEQSDSFFCEIPLAKRKLGTLNASKGYIEFKQPKHANIYKIHLTFEATLDTVLATMVTTYGHPEDGEYYYIWEHGGNETIRLFKSRRNTSYVTFEFDSSVGDSRKKNAKVESRKKNALKDF